MTVVSVETDAVYVTVGVISKTLRDVFVFRSGVALILHPE